MSAVLAAVPANDANESVAQAAPHLIKAKVKLKRGSPNAMLARADRMIEDMTGRFEAAAAARLARLRDVLQHDWPHPGRRDQARNAILGVLGDFEGEAATFHYDLVGLLAQRLTGYLRDVAPDAQEQREIAVVVHAIATVLANKVRGVGGKTGGALIREVARLVHRGTQRGMGR